MGGRHGRQSMRVMGTQELIAWLVPALLTRCGLNRHQGEALRLRYPEAGPRQPAPLYDRPRLWPSIATGASGESEGKEEGGGRGGEEGRGRGGGAPLQTCLSLSQKEPRGESCLEQGASARVKELCARLDPPLPQPLSKLYHSRDGVLFRLHERHHPLAVTFIHYQGLLVGQMLVFSEAYLGI